MAITLPFTFTNGTVADAIQVNANFSALVNTVGTGPLIIGSPLPSAPTPATLVADAIAIRSSAAGLVQLGMNIYRDPAGTSRYVDNGPAADISIHATTLAGANVPRLAINVGPNNTTGPGTQIAALTGAVNIVAAVDYSGATVPFVVLGSGADVPQPFPIVDSLICDQISSRAYSVPGSTDRVARIGLNAYVNNTNLPSWTYLSNGPGGSITLHDANVGGAPLPASSVRINVVDAGAAGTSMSAGSKFTILGDAGAAANQTNIMLMVNTSGTPTLIQVEVGDPNSGGTGRRALTVPN